MTMGRSLFSLAVLASLSACNMVVAEKPWFDAPSGPQLKDGLWANLNTPDCQVSADLPLAEWPGCAKPMLVRGGEYLGPGGKTDELPPEQRLDPANWDAIPHVLVDGNPQVDQIKLSPPKDAEGNPRASAGSPAAFGIKPDQDLYLFMAVRPTKRDEAGLITETKRWPVLCGPMPKNPKKSSEGMPSFTTDKPFKGLVIKEGACFASSVDALVNAARQSEAIAQSEGFSTIDSRWIRASVN